MATVDEYGHEGKDENGKVPGGSSGGSARCWLMKSGGRWGREGAFHHEMDFCKGSKELRFYIFYLNQTRGCKFQIPIKPNTPTL